MNYPKAGDLQRELATDLVGNPTPNPWEVRSSSGLEGVFADGDDAEFYADELRRSGATGVVARRRPAKLAQQRQPVGTPNPAGFSAKGERMYEQIKAAYEHKGDPRAAEIAARTVYASAYAGVEGLLKKSNPLASVREPWGPNTTIVIESHAHGYSGWLESADGNRIPISFGREPDTAREALELAKKFLRSVHAKANPCGGEMHGNPAPRFREGTRVRFAPTAASLRLYGAPPPIGTLGTVTTVSLGSRRSSAAKWSYLPGPGGGLTYVNWEEFGVQGVSPNDLKREGKRKNLSEEDNFDTDILGGMEKAIWVTSYADWVEGLTKSERKRAGIPGNIAITWDDVVPPTPADAQMAAQDLYELITRANGKAPGELFQEACRVDGCAWNDENADLFGHYLAMQAMGHGVAWDDDHKAFPLKMPAFFEAYSHDGRTVDWSPRGARNFVKRST